MRFAGYAAIFNRVDRGGDVVRAGAFRGAGAHLPLLWEHRPGRVIGRVELLGEDRRGLRVVGQVFDAAAAALVGAREVTGLSFGYRVRRARGRRPRELLALDIVEVSLVAMPMQPLARVHAVEEVVW